MVRYFRNKYFHCFFHNVFDLCVLNSNKINVPQVDDPDIVRALIVFGADVNVTNKRHETPRHIATLCNRHCSRDIVDALGFVGAVPCDQSKSGCTLTCNKPFQGEMAIGELNSTVQDFYN